MNVHQINITLTLKGPILTQGLGSKQFGLDTSIARNAQGEPVLPGSLIKGNLLHSINELNILTAGNFYAQHEITELFGTPANNNNEPARGLLNFDYYWALQTPLQENDNKTCNRIKIDEQLGTVEKGSLQVIESPFTEGENYSFTGIISCYSLNEERLQRLLKNCHKAFQYISHVGALKGIGFGKVIDVKVTHGLAKVKNQKDHKLKKLNRFSVNMTFDRPVCFSNQTNMENVFKTKEQLSGAIVKGAIANKIEHDANFLPLAKQLSAIKINWLKPSLNKTKPLTIPLCVAYNESDTTMPAFTNHLREQTPLNNANTSLLAKAWQSDWKNATYKQFYQQNKDYQPADIVKSLVVRTAINPYQENNIHLKNTAKDSQLFSYQCIENKNAAQASVNWQGVIDVSDTEDTATVVKQLQQVFATPLLGLGKTKAQASVTLTKAAPLPDINLNNSTTLAVVLESDALINLNISQYSPCLNVFEAYKQAFKNIDQHLELVDMCATQQLEGGGYYWHRYFKKTLTDYQPQLLTCAGSVFVFANNAATKTRISRWLRLGIDPSEGQLGNVKHNNNTEENWQLNPFNRGNGYGEITLLASHYAQQKENAYA